MADSQTRSLSKVAWYAKAPATVAFYPSCTSRNKKADSFHPYAPLWLLIGESDD